MDYPSVHEKRKQWLIDILFTKGRWRSISFLHSWRKVCKCVQRKGQWKIEEWKPFNCDEIQHKHRHANSTIEYAQTCRSEALPSTVSSFIWNIKRMHYVILKYTLSCFNWNASLLNYLKCTWSFVEAKSTLWVCQCIIFAQFTILYSRRA